MYHVACQNWLLHTPLLPVHRRPSSRPLPAPQHRGFTRDVRPSLFPPHCSCTSLPPTPPHILFLSTCVPRGGRGAPLSPTDPLAELPLPGALHPARRAAGRRARTGVGAPSLRLPTRSRWCPCALPTPADALAVASVRPPCACRGACGGVRAPTLRRPRRSRWRPCALHAHSIYFFSSPPCRACVFGWRSRAPPDVVALVSRRPPCAGRERIFLLSGLGSLVRWSCVWEYVRVWQCGDVRGYHAVVWLLFVKLGSARLDGGRFFLTR